MDPVDRSFPFHGYLQTFNKKEKITDEKAPPMLNVLKFWITYVFFKEKRRLIQKGLLSLWSHHLGYLTVIC